MPHTELQPFIDAAKTQGAADEFLATLLTRRGWSPNDVYTALGDWWSRATGVEIPARRSSAENARDAFLYLLAFSTLATWACALGSLCFRLIERWLPDAVIAPYYDNFRLTVTWQMASILVALPIYLFVMIQYSAVTVPFADHLETAKTIVKYFDGNLTFRDLVGLHNQARPLFPRLIFIGNAALTQWDIKSEFVYIYLTIYGTLAALLVALDADFHRHVEE